ncbi:hypothetical protein EXIGLDRAFT_833014 [Exidia glandulosa HHB12029]|uniref:F-box domain-containing protein n=1 Tax=Exidia glandulosa HHB12029 TaxID=1314781 RepID=A0A165L3Z4_EXIGL|nr:hypothetical protein EXIGLDRAFT_833014 [Exidia glandulosa HHB12029]
MSARLPSELWDVILDIVWSDDLAQDPALEKGRRRTASRPAPVIHACASVCKAWLPRARYWGFGRLRIGYKFRSPSQFVDIVSHPLCTFNTSVLHLSVSYQGAAKGELTKLGILWSSLYRLSNLLSLEFDGVNFLKKYAPVDRPVFCPQIIPANIITLTITWSSYDTARELVEGISHCRRLQSLTLSPPRECVDWDVPGTVPGALPVPSALRELDLVWGAPLQIQPVLSRLCPRPGALQLRNLSLHCMGTVDVAGVATFVQYAGQSVDSLSVDIPGGEFDHKDAGIATLCAMGGLSTLTSLRVFTLSGYITRKPKWISWDYAPTPRNIPLLMSHYISSLPSTCPAVELRFEIGLHRMGHWNFVPWRAVFDHVGRRFPLLERIVWAIPLEDDASELELATIRKTAQNLVGTCLRKYVEVALTTSVKPKRQDTVRG